MHHYSSIHRSPTHAKLQSRHETSPDNRELDHEQVVASLSHPGQREGGRGRSCTHRGVEREHDRIQSQPRRRTESGGVRGGEVRGEGVRGEGTRSGEAASETWRGETGWVGSSKEAGQQTRTARWGGGRRRRRKGGGGEKEEECRLARSWENRSQNSGTRPFHVRPPETTPEGTCAGKCTAKCGRSRGGYR